MPTLRGSISVCKAPTLGHAARRAVGIWVGIFYAEAVGHTHALLPQKQESTATRTHMHREVQIGVRSTLL